MSMRTLFQFFACPDRQLRRRSAPVATAQSLYPRAFREFTPPPRRQGGSSLRLGASGRDRLGRIAIVPSVGGKVP
ncbi:hypothetical protein [Xanthomonas sacchari]|uniref:hypothetical protein n=1 Tax=Xanthomonas sacchari TaxID=56458 RepID=UPI00225E6F09|nr:hypothetical protein [Xanthomonas sacchari]MCW0423275.1 hypothetical protein [Xanthomonas sacchari]